MPKKDAQLNLTAALSAGWQATSKYLGFYLTLAFLIVPFNLIPSVFEVFFDGSVYTPVVRGIFIALIALVTLGMVRTTIKSVDKKDLSIGELFHVHLFGKYIVTAILYLIMFFGGLMLFVVPGLYWGMKYQFATYLVVDRKLSIAASFEESARMVQGHEWDLFAYWLVMILLNVLGLLMFGIGIVITLPVTLVGYTYLYRQLRK